MSRFPVALEMRANLAKNSSYWGVATGFLRQWD
jgi:hypothetical protein